MPSPKAPSAKLLARRAAKVVMNREALAELELGMADALAGLGAQIVDEASANAPRDPATAERRGVPMMADTGNFVVFARGKKVAGDVGGTGKPRGMRTAAGEVVLGVWFASPVSHFAELGTVKEAARPFLLPAFNHLIPGAENAVPAAMARRARGSR